MPTYDYACDACKHEFEQFEAITAEPQKKCPKCKKNKLRRLFGAGGGKELADELGVPLMAQIPLVAQLREGGDDGRPIAAVAPKSEAGAAFHVLADQIAAMRPKRIFSSKLKLG